MLTQRTFMGIDELAVALDVVSMTIRRDIALLEEQGVVHSIPSGARLGPPPLPTEGDHLNTRYTEALVVRALEGAESGRSVFIHAVSPSKSFASKFSARAKASVVTSSLDLAIGYAGSGRDALFVGGRIDKRRGVGVGPLTRVVLDELALDLAIVVADEWNAESGVAVSGAPEAELLTAALEHSASSLLLAYGSRFVTRALTPSIPLQKFASAAVAGELPAGVNRFPVPLEVIAA